MKTLDDLNINKNLLQIFSISILTLTISACTQTNAAKIHDLSDSSNSKTSNYSKSTNNNSNTQYEQPPQNISVYNSNDESYYTTTQDNGDVVTTMQSRMTYNRNYDEIPKGGYSGNTYTVNKGDTLFYIAWITGNDFRSLAAKNNIKPPYELKIGQVLDVNGGTTVVVTAKTVTKPGAIKPTTSTTTTTTTTTNRPVSSTLSKIKPMTTQATSTTNQATTTTTLANNNTKKETYKPTYSPVSNNNIKWRWPARGKIIESYSNASKGIDIAGSLGDKIVAAASGRVVYAGNALPGYGNLIIIKHNDDYLTAYAHNQSFLVKEQQEVKAGQQIATMGTTGTNSVRLHFEIRYKAKSVDPLGYLK